jgi:nucleoid-associated protein YgaU
MGCVRPAVLEFDEEVRAPWRPLLVSGGAVPGPSTAPSVPRPSAGRRSRVGACRPPSPVAGRAPVSGSARRAALGPDARRPGPGGRPAPSPGDGRRGAGPAPAGPLRLTGRGRRLLVVVSLCGSVVLGSWLGPFLWGAGAEGLHLAGATSVVVEPGDTVWSIASAVTESGDVRTVVDQIQRLNDLEGAVLVPGQVLQLP